MHIFYATVFHAWFQNKLSLLFRWELSCVCAIHYHLLSTSYHCNYWQQHLEFMIKPTYLTSIIPKAERKKKQGCHILCCLTDQTTHHFILRNIPLYDILLCVVIRVYVNSFIAEHVILSNLDLYNLTIITHVWLIINALFHCFLSSLFPTPSMPYSSPCIFVLNS